MAQVFNHKTKRWEDRPDEEAVELLRAGTHTFGAGFDIPVVAPDGSLGTIKSEVAADAFRDGFRLQTTADRTAYAQKRQDEIKRERFDDPAMAATLGFARGATLGASDVALKAAGLGEETKAVKELSPIASGVGAVGGAITSTLAAPVAGLGLAGRGAQALTKGTEAALAARGVGTLGKTAGAMAVEGAYWGLGEGVSEAALGDPNEAISNVVANIGFGALTGGLFGAGATGARAATPYMQKLADSFLDLGEKTAKATARQIVEKVSVPALNLAGEKDIAKMFPGMLRDEALLKDLVATGRYAEAKALYKATMKSQTLVEKEAEQLTKSINAMLETAPKAEAKLIRQTLAEHKNDAYAAVRATYDRLSEVGREFDNFRATLTEPAVFGDDLLKEVGNYATKLSKFGGASRSTANEIKDLIKAYPKINPTEGGEANMIWQIKQLVDRDARKQIKGDAHGIAKKLWGRMDDLLKKEHPNAAIRDHWNQYDMLYRAYGELKGTITKSAKKGGGIDQFLFNPGTQAQVSRFLNDLGEYGAELSAIHKSGQSLAARKAALNEFNEKFLRLTGEPITPENKAAFEELINQLAPKAAKKLERLTEIQTTLAGIDQASPMDGLVKIYRALGKDVAELEPYAKFYQNWDKLQALERASSGDKLGLPIRGAVGYGLGGPVGAAVALGAEAASNPLKILKYVGQINRTAEKGKAALSKAFKRVSESLVSPTAARTATLSAIQAEPLERKRATYDQVTRRLAELSNPEVMAQAIERLGGAVEGMPQTKLAIATKAQIAAGYLLEQIPEDPLAGAQLTVRSPWKAPDAQITAFIRKYNAVMNPLSVVEAVAEGAVTPDEIRALEAVHPEIYLALQNSIMSGIMENGDKIPYSRRVLLGNLFNIPADYSLTPEFVAQMQQPFQPQDTGGRPSGGKPSGSLEISPFDTVQTETSRLTYGTT